MALFRNKFRIPSARWQEWDYQNAGAYFITICTKDRQMFFGQCKNGFMCLEDAGTIAHEYWQQIPEHFPHVSLGAFQVMPNHVHGIFILRNSRGSLQPDDFVETLQCNVSTGVGDAGTTNQFMSDISPAPGSVSTIVRSYKSACSKIIRRQYPDINFHWQARFHDRVIRNELEYHQTENYILSNTANWPTDNYFTA